MHNPCLPDRLHRVTAPVLLVGGAADGLVLSERYLEAIAERVSGRTEIVTIPAAGHRVEEEEPIEVAEKIVKFVSTSEPPA
jgi:pimeloyl-ACP methyl ester carboxylesterase